MEEREINEFNAALNFANHLEDTFFTASSYLAELDIFSHYHTLGALIRMLCGEMKEAELKEINSEWFELRGDINRFLESKRRGYSNVPPALLMKLHILEQKLRQIYRDSGLQNKLRTDARMALK